MSAQPRWRRVLSIGFLALVAILVVLMARRIDWGQVWTALRGYPVATLLAAAALAAVSHAIVAAYELVGRRLLGHALPVKRTAVIGAVAYAFNLNFGSLVGGIGMRMRQYARAGLNTTRVAQVIGVSVVTNWMGYALFGGALFALRPLDLPPEWRLDAGGLRWLGLAMIGVVVAYVVAAFVAPRRRWTIHGHTLTTPTGRFALLQIALSALNWATISTVVWIAFDRRVEYATVASVFLVAAIAGMASHVPGGIGVLETVFIALLSHRFPDAEIVAALIVYRAIYYIAPLAVAGIGLWWLERQPRLAPPPRRRRRRGQPREAPEAAVAIAGTASTVESTSTLPRMQKVTAKAMPAARRRAAKQAAG
jgi:uncharacterized membrane protein YbhN (UPF0104 family)